MEQHCRSRQDGLRCRPEKQVQTLDGTNFCVKDINTDFAEMNSLKRVVLSQKEARESWR